MLPRYQLATANAGIINADCTNLFPGEVNMSASVQQSSQYWSYLSSDHLLRASWRRLYHRARRCVWRWMRYYLWSSGDFDQYPSFWQSQRQFGLHQYLCRRGKDSSAWAQHSLIMRHSRYCVLLLPFDQSWLAQGRAMCNFSHIVRCNLK